MVEEHEMARTAAADSTPGAMEEYTVFKERILECIDAMSSAGRFCRDSCEGLREKLLTNTFNLVVVGQFKRGKTCLINALLGVDVLPVAVVPLTSIVTILTFGESLTAKVFYENGRVEEIDPGTLGEYVTETGNPANAKGVSNVVMTYPSEYLKGGVRLIDTPGVGSVYQHNTDIAYRYLPQCDAALFLLSVEQPVSRAEIDFLEDVRQYSDRIFFLLNKIDYLTEDEQREAVSFSQSTLKEALGRDVKVFPLSARLALDGKLKGSREMLHRSNLPAFSQVLHRFLVHEKGNVLLVSAVNSLLRILSQARLQLQLELKSLTEPLQDLEEKIAAFEEKKREVLLQKEDFDILIDGEIQRLIKNGLDEDLAAFKREQIPEMERRFESFYEQNRHLTLKDLHEALDAFVSEEVERVFSGWFSAEEEKIRRAFEAICGRFIGSINDTVETLLHFSSRLFTVPFESVKGEALWSVRPSFYGKVREEPVGLEMLDASVTQILPRYVSDRFERIKSFLFRRANERIFRKAKEKLFRLSDMQSGRIRYDFVERLNRGKVQFRREVLEKVDATIEGISSAIEKGMQLRSGREEEIEERKVAIESELARMEEVRGELMRIREGIEGS